MKFLSQEDAPSRRRINQLVATAEKIFGVPGQSLTKTLHVLTLREKLEIPQEDVGTYHNESQQSLPKGRRAKLIERQAV